MSGRLRIALGVSGLALALLSLAACGRGALRQREGGAAGTTGATGQGIKFAIAVDFTGARAIKGSFVDDDHAGDGTCGQYASLNVPVVGWLGPQTPVGKQITISGAHVSYGLGVGHDRFHGPGTYDGGVLMGLEIGGDTFVGRNSSVTIDADGSGSATFTNLMNLKGSQPESGTMRWTCSANQ